MLHLLRNIRRKLISQDNVRRYLLYAIGEIILVVIGILIALQINNWNEERKLAQERITLTSSLISDLKEDQELIDNSVRSLNQILNENQSLYDRMNSSGATLDTLKLIGFYEFNPIISDVIDKYNTVTFNTIQSAGKIDLFTTNIRESIFNYYTQLGYSLVDNNTGIYFDKTADYTRKYPLLIPPHESGNYLNKIHTRIEDEREFVALLSNMINYKILMVQIFIDEYKATKIRAGSLINTLESSL